LEKTMALEKGRYRFLYEAASANIKIIESALKEQEEAFVKPLKPSSAEELAKSRAAGIQEVPIPEGAESRKEFYPDNTLKLEQYYLNGVLHGPSTYFSKEGRILSYHGYVNGLQQGKAWQFYMDGSLASIQRFRDGQWDGLQEYYYPHGTLKSEINYSHGL